MAITVICQRLKPLKDELGSKATFVTCRDLTEEVRIKKTVDAWINALTRDVQVNVQKSRISPDLHNLHLSCVSFFSLVCRASRLAFFHILALCNHMLQCTALRVCDKTTQMMHACDVNRELPFLFQGIRFTESQCMPHFHKSVACTFLKVNVFLLLHSYALLCVSQTLHLGLS